MHPHVACIVKKYYIHVASYIWCLKVTIQTDVNSLCSFITADDFLSLLKVIDLNQQEVA